MIMTLHKSHNVSNDGHSTTIYNIPKTGVKLTVSKYSTFRSMHVIELSNATFSDYCYMPQHLPTYNTKVFCVYLNNGEVCLER